jgi:predicted RNase H-like nuclease (RuvC/YqgF family)
MAAKLKVFRTPIGFHDAYVAVPSQKAALAAWGAEGNLFAHGSAEQVDDPELTRAPLAEPGKVIKVLRGSTEQHLASIGDNERQRPPHGESAQRAEPAKPPARKRPDVRRPSRTELAAAEADLDEQRRALEAEVSNLEAERARLQARIAELRQNGEERRKTLAGRVEQLRTDYEAAMDRWRAD